MTLFEDLEARGLIAQYTDKNEIKELINNGKAKFYIGFDPTADSLHVGHFMTLVLMKRLQNYNNYPIVLLGGGTGHIGDPSGRNDMRKMMDKSTIEYNVECFKKQIGKFINFDKALVVNNQDWLLKLNYVDLLREVGSCFSVNNMLRAECYKQRMEKGLSFLEFNYMIMQSYDFYYLFKNYGCNLQFGGDDQWSNMLAGTELIRKKFNKDAYAMTINLLTNKDGQKMGKTTGGAVWLDENKTSPFDFFQYWRNIDDADVIKCFKMLTFVPIEKIYEYEKYDASRINELKELLAFTITEMVHGTEKANDALARAKSLFSGNQDNIEELKLDIANDIDVKDLLVLAKLVTSKSEARRLIEQNGLLINDNKVSDVNLLIKLDELKAGIKVKKGKKVFLKIIAK